ncbi:GrpB family protein [Bacillus sp. JJ722]|uniref:GrpB family protein n=1 Tax=Bacillus sp. JJ722 TaxID=3122973 RepID=UPI003000DC73
MESPVIIESYQPEWAIQFQAEQRLLKGIVGKHAIEIEHIGSTSIEGLGAKPTLDIMMGVHELSEVEESIEKLKHIGYEYVFHKEFPSRRFFRKGKWRAGTHHLHVYKYESEEWINNLLFRDFLRTHPVQLKQYYQLKIELAQKYRNDRVSYTKAKESFIQSIIKKAKEEI